MLNLPFRQSNGLAQDVHILKGSYMYQVHWSTGEADLAIFPFKKMVSTENLGLIVRTSPIGQGLEQSSRLKSA